MWFRHITGGRGEYVVTVLLLTFYFYFKGKNRKSHADKTKEYIISSLGQQLNIIIIIDIMQMFGKWTREKTCPSSLLYRRVNYKYTLYHFSTLKCNKKSNFEWTVLLCKAATIESSSPSDFIDHMEVILNGHLVEANVSVQARLLCR